MGMFILTSLISMAIIAAGIGSVCLVLEYKGIAISDYIEYIKYMLFDGTGFVNYLWYVIIIIFYIYMFMHSGSNILASILIIATLYGIAGCMYRY